MSQKWVTARDPSARGSGGAPATHRGHPIAFFVALLFLAAGAAYATLAILTRVESVLLPGTDFVLPGRFGALPGLEPSATDLSTATERINILVLGLDRRPHHDPNVDGPPRADSMYIISLDPVLKTGSVLAIPRDLYVQIPNPKGGTDLWDTRINTAYHFGALYKYPGGGPALARETVERSFRREIHYYAALDWLAFAEIIDALGGIEVTVPQTIRSVEGFNPRDGNAFTITIPAGRQRMDSVTALAYSRYREGLDGDFGRVQRQQDVMLAVMEKGLALGWLGRAPALYAKFRAAVDTDVSTVRLPGLVALVRQIGLDRVQMASLAGDDGENVARRITPYGEDVLVPIWERMGPALSQAIPDQRLQDEGAIVKLMNATTTVGLASRGVAILTRYGFQPGDLLIADAARDERRASTAVVIYGEKEYTAQRIIDLLGVPRASVQRRDPAMRPPGEADIVVMLGTDLALPDDSRFDDFAPR